MNEDLMAMLESVKTLMELYFKQAVLTEREYCARLAEEDDDLGPNIAARIAKKIRNRQT